jgi:hypothetical protein
MKRQFIDTSLLSVLPHFFIFGGIALIWFGLDPNGWLMGVGFIFYGVIGIIESIEKSYYKNGLLKKLKGLTQILILVFAINYVFTGLFFIGLLMLMLLDILVLTASRVEGFTTEEKN